MTCRSETTRLDRLARRTLIFVAAVAPAGGAIAQPSSFTPVDQFIVDVSPLSASLRVVEPDLGPPQGFSRVYTSPDFPGQYLRMNGAVIVAFPRSEYDVNSRGGIVPMLPDGAVFYIGSPPTTQPGSTSMPRPSSGFDPYADANPLKVRSHRLDLRAPSRMVTGADLARHPPAPIAQTNARPTVWSNELYRRSRLSLWLAVAAADRR